MSIARVTELSATSETSFEDAIDVAIARATRTLRGVKGAWVKDMNVSVVDGNIRAYRVNLEGNLPAGGSLLERIPHLLFVD
jgi:dodecin